jgi:hypothetical protein
LNVEDILLDLDVGFDTLGKDVVLKQILRVRAMRSSIVDARGPLNAMGLAGR